MIQISGDTVILQIIRIYPHEACVYLRRIRHPCGRPGRGDDGRIPDGVGLLGDKPDLAAFLYRFDLFLPGIKTNDLQPAVFQLFGRVQNSDAGHFIGSKITV